MRKTDVGLMVAFPLTFISGLLLHAAGHWPGAIAVRTWILIHALAGILLIVFSIRHVVQHWAWFKTPLSKLKKHSTITILTALSFLLVSITGILLIIGNNSWSTSHLPIFHAKAGLLFSVFALWHCLKRIKVFKKLKGAIK